MLIYCVCYCKVYFTEGTVAVNWGNINKVELNKAKLTLFIKQNSHGPGSVTECIVIVICYL